MLIRLKKLSNDIKIPSYAHPGDAGLDLFSQEDHLLKPGDRHCFRFGFSLELPENHVGIIKDRSGLALNHGIHNLAGVIDSGYRGEYTAVIINLSNEDYQVKKGDKIAQLLVMPVVSADIEISTELTQASRGSGAFGSTGKR